MLLQKQKILYEEWDIMTPLHIAAAQGDLAKATRLLAEGADINARNQHGRTPLHLTTVTPDYTAVAALLLESGADVNAANNWGETPLALAAIYNHTALAQLLIENGADVNAVNNWGKTPLHLAAMEGCADVVELLLERGANVNAKDSEGYTPLRWAAHKGRVRVLELLLDNGANVDAFYGNIGSKPLSVLVYFVVCLDRNREGSSTRAPNWIFHSQKCITIALNFMLAKKHEISEDKMAVFIRLINVAFNNIFAINRAVLAAIVVDNDNPKAQKAMFTCALKQYAMLLENREATTEQSQQLESDYTDIITAAVQANPNLYYIARSFCNSVNFIAERADEDAFNLVQSYLTTERYTLHDGVKLDTRARLLKIVKEAMPQEESIDPQGSIFSKLPPLWLIGMVGGALLGGIILGFTVAALPYICLLATAGIIIGAIADTHMNPDSKLWQYCISTETNQQSTTQL